MDELVGWFPLFPRGPVERSEGFSGEAGSVLELDPWGRRRSSSGLLQKLRRPSGEGKAGGASVS